METGIRSFLKPLIVAHNGNQRKKQPNERTLTMSRAVNREESYLTAGNSLVDYWTTHNVHKKLYYGLRISQVRLGLQSIMRITIN